MVLQLLSHEQLFATLCTAAHQASLSFTVSQGLLKLMSIELVMPSNRLVLCCPLFPLPSIFPSISIFSIIGLVGTSLQFLFLSSLYVCLSLYVLIPLFLLLFSC